MIMNNGKTTVLLACLLVLSLCWLGRRCVVPEKAIQTGEFATERADVAERASMSASPSAGRKPSADSLERKVANLEEQRAREAKMLYERKIYLLASERSLNRSCAILENEEDLLSDSEERQRHYAEERYRESLEEFDKFLEAYCEEFTDEEYDVLLKFSQLKHRILENMADYSLPPEELVELLAQKEESQRKVMEILKEVFSQETESRPALWHNGCFSTGECDPIPTEQSQSTNFTENSLDPPVVIKVIMRIGKPHKRNY